MLQAMFIIQTMQYLNLLKDCVWIEITETKIGWWYNGARIKLEARSRKLNFK